MRLVIRTTEKGEKYENFFYYVDKSVFHKTSELRREILGRPPAPGPITQPDEAEPEEEETEDVELVSWGDLEKKFGKKKLPSTPPLSPELIDVREAIDNEIKQSPERAASFFTLIEREGRHTKWKPFVEEFPWSEEDRHVTFNTKKAKLKKFLLDDKSRFLEHLGSTYAKK